MRDLSDPSVLCGVYGHPHAARVVAAGLSAMRERVAATGVGVAVAGSPPRSKREAGLGLLDDAAALEALGGTVAVGELHDESGEEARLGLLDAPARPVVAAVVDAWVVVGCSGAGPADAALARELLASGAALGATGLGALTAALLARARQRTTVNRLVEALWRLAGGHALVIATTERLVGVRDPHGLRSLVLGVVGDAHVLASDASGVIGAGGVVVRDLEPGEMVVVDARGVVSLRPFARVAPRACVQEVLQLASAGSQGQVHGVWAARAALGDALAHDHAAPADLVVAADDTSRAAASGYARRAGVSEVPAWCHGPGAPPRAVEGAVRGQRVVLVGVGLPDALGARVSALWLAGAAEVHVRTVAPPRTAACLYGVRGPDAPVDDPAQAASRVGASTAAWLDAARLLSVLGVGPGEGSWCLGCLGGAWPVPPEAHVDQLQLFDEPPAGSGAPGSSG